MRKSGLDVVGEVAWGAHFCQFFQTRQDLLDVLVPYFRAGLENHEFCMWVTSEPLHTEEAKVALASVVPDLDQRIAAGQMEILDYRQWYVRDGRFDADRVLRGWVDKLETARQRGFEGLRLTGNTFWLEDRLWKDFSDYEEAVDTVIGQYRMLALCTYSLDRCGVFQVMDVVRNHQFALIRQGNRWEVIQSAQRAQAESALRESEQRYRTLFSTMSEGFALHEIVYDSKGRPCDYRFLQVNPAFERQTGLKAADLIGRTVREVLPEIEPIWIERYGRVALTGQPEQFEARAESLGRWYDVRAYQTVPGRFAVVFTDITERKQNERNLCEVHEQLQLQAEELQTANEELRAQAEELQASNEELREQELVLRESEERFRATYEQAAIGIELQSLDGRYLRGNGTLCRILGYSQQELLQRRFRDITHPEDLPQEELLLDDLLAGRIPNYTIEKRYLHQEGHSVWVRVTSSLARTSQPYRISIIEDITERKQAEEALRESEERYRRFFDEDLTGDFLATPDGRVLECNPAFAEIYGFGTLADAAQSNLSQFNPEDWAALMRRLRGRRKVLGHECVHRRPDGTEIHVVANVVGRFDATGELVEVKGYVFDDTERKQAEEALRESEERYRHFFDEDLTGDFLAKPDGRVLECNPAFAEIYRFPDLADAARCNLSQFNPEDWAALMGGLRSERKVLGHECVHRRPDGTEIHVVANVVGHLDAAGELAEIKGYVFDDTERKRAEGQLLRLNRTLRALSNSSQALMHATEEAAYLREVCKIVAEDCGHALVWIGYAEEDEARSVRPVAYAGFEEGYLETLRITWADSALGRGPTGTAIRTGQPTLCRNMLTDPNFAPWREEARKRGYASSIGLPLLSEGRALGAITIYSQDPDPFSADELKLLVELATDLSHGITSLRLRAAHAHAEEMVRQSEQRLRLALEGGGMGLWEWDVRNDSTFWDPRVYELLGLDPHTPASSSMFFRVVTGPDRDRVRQLLDRTLAEGEDFQAEFRVDRPNGESPWLISRGKVIRDERGRAVRMMGVMYDITQRKQMEADLRRLNDQLEEEVQAQTEELKDTVDRLQNEVARRVLAEGRLRRRSQMLEAFFQHTITPLAFMDKDFNFVRVNNAYARADGKEPEYFVGRNHFTLYPHDENRAIFEQVVQTKRPYFARAKPFTYPDSPYRVTFWDWQLTPLLDDRGDVQFLVLNLEDVTEQQTAFQKLEHRARQLQKLTLELSQAEDRERKRLAEILHDDLQQQLAAAKFHLSLLGNRIPRDKAIRQSIAQLDQIIKDAIEKSRSLSHELSPALLYQGDLGETFEWMARQLKAKHGLTVHVENRDRVDSVPEALKVFLYRTAQEILFNVVKHARIREARLRLQRVRSSVWLTISDQGQGFDPRLLNRTGGFGLLSIRERIELLGGRMKIRSVPGRGSTFLIAVPDGRPTESRRPKAEDGMTRAEVGAVPRDPSAVLRSASSALRVLLVDDHKVMREGLAALLKEQVDLEVVGQAGNGREAVDLAYQLGPDVVIMDAAMPLMAGDEATRQIKLHLPDVRVVGLSMFEEADMAEAMHRAGAEAYLLKTAPFEELLAAIRGRSSNGHETGT